MESQSNVSDVTKKKESRKKSCCGGYKKDIILTGPSEKAFDDHKHIKSGNNTQVSHPIKPVPAKIKAKNHIETKIKTK